MTIKTKDFRSVGEFEKVNCLYNHGEYNFIGIDTNTKEQVLICACKEELACLFYSMLLRTKDDECINLPNMDENRFLLCSYDELVSWANYEMKLQYHWRSKEDGE